MRKDMRGKKSRYLVGMLPREETIVWGVAYSPPIMNIPTWEFLGRPNWCLRVNASRTSVQAVQLYGSTNVPCCCPLAVPFESPIPLLYVEAGELLVQDGVFKNVAIKALQDPHGNVSSRLRLHKTGQRVCYIACQCNRDNVQTFSEQGFDPALLTPTCEIPDAQGSAGPSRSHHARHDARLPVRGLEHE